MAMRFPIFPKLCTFLLLLASQAVAEKPSIPAWKHRVYLTSYPRSGNHWMRYLIEEATGIATGSVYPDPDPTHRLMPWGAYWPEGGYEGNRRSPQANEIMVLKTHAPALDLTPFDRHRKQKAVRIVRHPVDAFWSWNANIGLPEPLVMTDDYLTLYIFRWRLFETYWNKQPNTLTIRYEDLFQDPYPVLKAVLEHCGIHVPDENIRKAVAHYYPVGKVHKYFHHYSPEQLKRISQELGDLMIRYSYEIP